MQSFKLFKTILSPSGIAMTLLIVITGLLGSLTFHQLMLRRQQTAMFELVKVEYTTQKEAREIVIKFGEDVENLKSVVGSIHVEIMRLVPGR